MKGRVAWIRPLEEIPGQDNQYKVGVEFLNLKTKSLIKRFLQTHPALVQKKIPGKKTVPKVGVGASASPDLSDSR